MIDYDEGEQQCQHGEHDLGIDACKLPSVSLELVPQPYCTEYVYQFYFIFKIIRIRSNDHNYNYACS